MRLIYESAEPIYLASTFYPRTIWPHAMAVAKYAKDFAAQLRGNVFVAEAAGVLHDIGAAKLGKQDHHVRGAELATGILLECGCPARQIGAIVKAIYSHRASQNIPIKNVASICVAAADAKDHFENAGELWMVADKDWGIIEMQRCQFILDKLERDWKKTAPEIRAMMNGSYENARTMILRIANGRLTPAQRPIVRMCGNGKPP